MDYNMALKEMKKEKVIKSLVTGCEYKRLGRRIICINTMMYSDINDREKRGKWISYDDH